MTDNVSEYQRFTRRMLIAVSVVAAIFGLFVLLWHLAEVLLAVFAAVLFAVWLDGLALLVSQRTRIGRGWALLMVILVLLVGIGSFGMLAGTQVSDQLSQLGQRVPIALDQLRSLVDANSWGH
ncbi:MAG: hypothetical protein P8180_15410, partial [Gammaproteobacteria bacterium]